MKKKILSLCLVVVLLLTAITGTLAYFTDEDSAENIFAVGDVDIMLREYGVFNEVGYADDDYREVLENYESMPGITTDKDVWVENVGTQSAYVRVIMSVDKDLTPNWAEYSTQWTLAKKLDYGDHMVYVFETNEPVAANTETAMIMDSFTLKADIDEVSIDDGYNITVNVYAIQSAGLDKDAAYTQLDAEFPKAMPVLVTTTEELIAAIAAVEKGVPTEISLATGEYVVGQFDFELADKEITFRGTEDAVINLTSWDGPTYHTNAQRGIITFDGVTMKWAEYNTKYQGFAGAPTLTYKNCTLYGTQSVDGTASFINCVFQAENTFEKAYAIYVRSGEATFTDCVMYTDGRAIMMYADTSADMKVVLNNCSFYDNGNYDSKDKAVVETGTNSHSSTFEIVINNCTTYGFEKNDSTSNLWGNKDNVTRGILNVVIDGVDVY